MKIKICGLKYEDNIKEVTSFDPDYLGFVFYVKSKRFVEALKPEDLEKIPKKIKKVGVFVNESVSVTERIAKNYKLDVLQLHGNELPQECNALQQKGYTVIKAFSIGNYFDFTALADYENATDYFLFDTQTADYGGSGNSFNWQVLAKYNLSRPFFLSGGLGLHNIKQFLQFKHPQLYGYDFNSRLETAPGLKDTASVQSLIEKIKRHEYL